MDGDRRPPPRRAIAGGLLPRRRHTVNLHEQPLASATSSPRPLSHARRTGTTLSVTPTLSSSPPPLPAHWAVPRQRVLSALFSAACLVAVGKPHLADLWRDCNGICGELGRESSNMKEKAAESDECQCTCCARCLWQERTQREDPFLVTQERWKEKVTTVTVVAGLILSSTAALCTTTPPVPGVLNYTVLTPYYLLLVSLVVSLGGLIVGASVIYMLANAIDPVYFRRRLMSNRRKVLCFLALMAYPFLSIGVSTMVSALGLFSAAWVTPDVLVRIGSTFGLCLPISLAFAVVYMQSGADVSEEDELPTAASRGMTTGLPTIGSGAGVRSAPPLAMLADPETYDGDGDGDDGKGDVIVDVEAVLPR